MSARDWARWKKRTSTKLTCLTPVFKLCKLKNLLWKNKLKQVKGRTSCWSWPLENKRVTKITWKKICNRFTSRTWT
jgi:hypothetical protein